MPVTSSNTSRMMPPPNFTSTSGVKLYLQPPNLRIVPVDAQMIAEIRNSVSQCSDHGLIAAAKWSSELLASIPIDKRKAASHDESNPDASMASFNLPDNNMDLKDQEEEDDVVLARCCMKSRQYAQAIRTLDECSGPNATFLKVYCQFLVGERNSVRQWHKLDNTRHQPPLPINNDIPDYLEKVEGGNDAWLLFLRALFLSRLSRKEEAIDAALQSIALFRWNWSTWTLVANLIESQAELDTIVSRLPLPPNHPLENMLRIHIHVELHNPIASERWRFDALLGEDYFPGSLWLRSLRAKHVYDTNDVSQALVEFHSILKADDKRVDDVAVYSNLLYTKNMKHDLTSVAEKYLLLDKNRPEVCCAVGNQYSLRSEHEKAVKYFRRATELDRTFHHAWTLMGHEYLEMGNTHAAVEAYRRAVDANVKDYRAWFGLGQAYIQMSMHTFAVYYLQRAAAVSRPFEPILWDTMGTCYEELGKPDEATICYKNALTNASPVQALGPHVKLQRIYRAIGLLKEIRIHGAAIIDIVDNHSPKQKPKQPLKDYMVYALMDLSESEERAHNLPNAIKYLQRVVDEGPPDDSSAAKRRLEQLHSRMRLMAIRADIQTNLKKAAAAAAIGP